MFFNNNISIYRRGKKLYLQYFVNGKRYQKSTRLDDTPANRKLLKREVIPQLQLKIASGEINKKSAKTFDYYAQIWLQQKEHLKTYREWYNIYENQLKSVFGKTKIDEIKRSDIKKFADAKLMQVSPQRVRTLINCIKAIIDIAVDYEDVASNPALNIKLPPNTKVRVMKPFSKDEVRVLIDNAQGWFKNYVAFAFYTGARHGEIIALNISDIDLDKKIITINKRIKKGKIDTPKTKSSTRKIPILDVLIPFIKSQLELCKEHKYLRLFFNPNTNRGFVDTKKLTQFWKPLIEGVGLEYRVFYNTRHTFATNMIRAGVPILDVSQILGHKGIEETIKTYAKYLPEEHLKISRKIDPFTDNTTDTIKEIKL